MKQKKNKINCICANVLILSMYRCTDVPMYGGSQTGGSRTGGSYCIVLVQHTLSHGQFRFDRGNWV